MKYNFKLGIYLALASFLGLQSDLSSKECVFESAPRVLLPPKESDNDWYFTAGYLLEQVRLTGTQYAYRKNGNAIGATALPAVGTILEPSFSLTSGLTAGFAYYFCNKNWTFKSRFDWIQSTGKGSQAIGYNDNIIPINIWRDQLFAPVDADLGVAGRGISKFTVSYYNVNFDLHRELYIDENFSLMPHVGLKLSFIYDKAVTKFTGNGFDTAFSPTTHLNTATLKRRETSDFWGIGPSFGVDTNWRLFSDVSFFFEGGVALLLGTAKDTDSVSCTAFASSSTASSSPSSPVFSPAAQSLIGFKYERMIYCDTQKVIGKIGWDSSIYWNQWNHINTKSEGTFNSSLDTFQLQQGDMFGLTGLLISLTWNF